MPKLMGNYDLCNMAVVEGEWDTRLDWMDYVNEAKRRGLTCNVKEETDVRLASSSKKAAALKSSDVEICAFATEIRNGVASWNEIYHQPYVKEAQRRGLSCGVKDSNSTQTVNFAELYTDQLVNADVSFLLSMNDSELCNRFNDINGRLGWEGYFNLQNRLITALKPVLKEVHTRGLNCTPGSSLLDWASITDESVCHLLMLEIPEHLSEAKRRGLSCGVNDSNLTQTASSTVSSPNTVPTNELTAAQKEAESLRQELAALKAKKQQEQQNISNDNKLPTIEIISATASGARGLIKGRVNDNTGVAELLIDGQKIGFDSKGSFSATTYVPEGGASFNIEAIDMAGLSSEMSVQLNRMVSQTASILFEKLNPLNRKTLPNKDAVALIIGIGNYENIIDATYADKDAVVFRDYAIEKLGVPENRIKTLINKDAEIGELLLSIRKWIRRSTKADKSDIYIFYAGHGIATANGESYIIPYDGRSEIDLLDRTALLQKELFEEVAKAKPRNVTVFLDACYTGKARTGEVLLADANYRPVVPRAIDEGSLPYNFTLMTASSGDEFSGPLEEAKHGMFSYFLMKGMEGDADANRDNKITAGELHVYVKENVLRQSADKQTPELQGDAGRVLVRFQ